MPDNVIFTAKLYLGVERTHAPDKLTQKYIQEIHVVKFRDNSCL